MSETTRRSDVMSRTLYDAEVQAACRPRTSDPDVVKAYEERRWRLMDHDAALRERVEELEGALRNVVAKYKAGSGDCQHDFHEAAAIARRALNTGERE